MINQVITMLRQAQLGPWLDKIVCEVLNKVHRLSLHLPSSSCGDWTNTVGSSTPVRKHRAYIQFSVQRYMFTLRVWTANKLKNSKGQKPLVWGSLITRYAKFFWFFSSKTNRHHLPPGARTTSVLLNACSPDARWLLMISLWCILT